MTLPHPRSCTSGKNKRRGGVRRPLTAPESTDWALLTPRGLWTQIRDELLHYFGWQLGADSVDATVAKYKLQKISLFRSVTVRKGNGWENCLV